MHLSSRTASLGRTSVRRWIPPSIQVRTQVTQQLPPKPAKPMKRSKLRKLQEEAKKPLSKRIKWSEVDLSAVELPKPRFPEPQLQFENGRTFYKHPLSRKVLLHTEFTNLLLRHPVLLFINLYKTDAITIVYLRQALTPYGAHLRLIRKGIFLAALRVAQYVEGTRTKSHELWDPSGLAMHAKIRSRRRKPEELELKQVLKGNQACAVYFDSFNWRPESIDTATIAAVVKILERTGKTPIIGARFMRTAIGREDVKRLTELPKVGRLRQELVALLSGPSRTVSGMLQSAGQSLALTLEGRQKAMEEEQGQAK